MAGSFVDTNIVLYTLSQDATKAARAASVLEAGGAISVQVLNETTNVARRKMRLDWPDTRAILAVLRELLEVHPVTIDTHTAALDLAERYGLSTYDALMAASALQAGCTILWSEDMHHGLLLDGRLRIQNPFRS